MFYLSNQGDAATQASWAAASLNRRPGSPLTVRLSKGASGFGLVFDAAGVVTGLGGGSGGSALTRTASPAAAAGFPCGARLVAVDGS